jgi:hypothetical protein
MGELEPCTIHASNLYHLRMPTNQTSSSNLPSRYRLAAVKRYEAAIRKAILNYPNVTVLSPADAGLSLSTYTARLRDAMKSLYEHQWSGVLSDTELDRFNDVYLDMQVGERAIGENGQVWVGSTDLMKLKAVVPLVAERPAVFVVDRPTDDEVRALCVLCNTRRLPQQLMPITLTNYTNTDFLSRLENEFDVSFEHRDGKITLL